MNQNIYVVGMVDFGVGPGTGTIPRGLLNESEHL